MRTYVASGLVIAVLAAMDALAQEGCNDAVRAKCTSGTASVCSTDKCNEAEVNGKAFNSKMIEEHNKCRLQAFTNGQFGADMIEVTWDKQLENAALGWAQQLCNTDTFQHDNNDCRVTQRYNSVGQNLYRASGDQYKNETVMATAAVTKWCDEIVNITANRMFPYQLTPAAGHYTQTVWSLVYRIGCAMVKTKTAPYKVVVACNYSPGGNVVGGGNVFNPACKAGSACRPGTTNRGSGLCQITDEDKYRQHVGLDTVPSSQS